MKLGFDIDEPDTRVLDGTAEASALSPSQHVDLFVSLCARLRAMGAIEVRAEAFRARFTPLSPEHAEPDKHEQARESVRMQEARRLLDDEASELP